MLKIDRIAIWVFIVAFALQLFNVVLGYVDELSALCLVGLAAIDCVANKNWSHYKGLGLIILIMTFYALYSVTAVKFNTTGAVIKDWVIEIKPYVPFFVMLSIAPRFTDADKKILRVIAWVQTGLLLLIMLIGNSAIDLIFQHPAYFSMSVFIDALVLLYCYIEPDGSLSDFHKSLIMAVLLVGVYSMKAKYLGELVVFLFFLFAYKPGMTRHISTKQLVTFLLLIGIILLVTWNKITYYFIDSMADFDPNEMSSYARPALYVGFWLIVTDLLPFGSGLASYASFPSMSPYSGAYAEYGLSNVYGLSEDYPNFICDAFYPSLAQFGIVGVVLFILFWIYIYRYLRLMIRYNGEKYKYFFAAGVLIMCFDLFESIAGTAFTNAYGMECMMMLGMLCAIGNELPKPESAKEKTEIKNKRIII